MPDDAGLEGRMRGRAEVVARGVMLSRVAQAGLACDLPAFVALFDAERAARRDALAARDAAAARAGEWGRLLREFYEAEGAFGCGCVCTAGGRCAGCRARLSAAADAAGRALGGEAGGGGGEK